MMNTFLQTEDIRQGKVIRGRWEGNSYKIIKPLGQGGSGSVYLAEDARGVLRALKVSADLFALTSEFRILVFLKSRKELSDLQVVPGVYEIDDFQIGRNVYHFIVLEYCTGQNLGRLSGRLSLSDTILIGQRVGEFLAVLHRIGFIFGDLKPGNVIYDFSLRRVRVIDFGSVALKGAALKQFTPGYDRESWQVGNRYADESYDVFSLGILMVTMLLGKIHHRKVGLDSILLSVSRKIANQELQGILRAALNQEIGCREISRRLGQLAERLPDTRNDAAPIFMKGIKAISGTAFVFGLLYQTFIT